MWIVKTSRENLLDLLAMEQPLVGREPQNRKSLAEMNDGEVQLVWARDPNKHIALPSLLVISKSEKTDFLAWSATYLSSFRPLTAYFRVLDLETASILLKAKARPPSYEKFMQASLGLIIAELASEFFLSDDNPKLVVRLDLARVSASACARTLSFALARALSLGVLEALEKGQGLIVESWSRLRELTGQGQSRFTQEEVCLPWNALLKLKFKGKTAGSMVANSLPTVVLETCKEILESGKVTDKWGALEREVRELRGAPALMLGPREQRVQFFERVTSRIKAQNSKRKRTLPSFVCGLLASEVSPGSMDHIALLQPLLRFFPSALLWYGICAGLREPSDKLLKHSEGLGLRVIRDLLRPGSLLEPPSCDIASDELDVLSGGAPRALDFRTRSREELEVEIAPCLTVPIRWNRPNKPSQQELFPRADIPQYEVRGILVDLTAQLERLDSMRRRISRLLGDEHPKRGRRTRR